MTSRDLARRCARTVAMSSPDTRNCTGKPTGGPFSSRDTRPRSSGKSVVEQRRAGARASARASSMLVRDEHELREVRLRELLVERQVEARRAGADVGDVALDALVACRAPPRACCACRHRSPRTSCLRAAAGRPSAPARDDAGKNCCGTKRNSASARDEDGERRRRARSCDARRTRRSRARSRAVERRAVDRRDRPAIACAGSGAAGDARPQPRASDGLVQLVARPAAACSRGTE